MIDAQSQAINIKISLMNDLQKFDQFSYATNVLTIFKILDRSLALIWLDHAVTTNY